MAHDKQTAEATPEIRDRRASTQDMFYADEPDYAGILAREADLRVDGVLWHPLWAPMLAVAARRTGDPAARALLDDAIEGGFAQPELFGDAIAECFGQEPDWPALDAAMRRNATVPRVAVTEWPELSLSHPVLLTTIAPERAELLRDRLPAAKTMAWDTAVDLLNWVSNSWQHDGWSHVDLKDAIHVLDRAAEGERFACVEYAMVLAQALNARGIPARILAVLTTQHHTGLGRSHLITDAWIDELDAWVVLDGQNAIYWADDDGRPLSAVELRDRYRSGAPQPRAVSVDGKDKAGDGSHWYTYFHAIRPPEATISERPYPAIQMFTTIHSAEQLRADATGTYPDLLEVGVGVVDTDIAIVPWTRHPYATGFEVTLGDQTWRIPVGGSWPVPRDKPGEHAAEIATITPFGANSPRSLRFTIS